MQRQLTSVKYISGGDYYILKVVHKTNYAVLKNNNK